MVIRHPHRDRKVLSSGICLKREVRTGRIVDPLPTGASTARAWFFCGDFVTTRAGCVRVLQQSGFGYGDKRTRLPLIESESFADIRPQPVRERVVFVEFIRLQWVVDRAFTFEAAQVVVHPPTVHPWSIIMTVDAANTGRVAWFKPKHSRRVSFMRCRHLSSIQA